MASNSIFDAAPIIDANIFDWLPGPRLIEQARELRRAHLARDWSRPAASINMDRHYPPDIAIRNLRWMVHETLINMCRAARRGSGSADSRTALTNHGRFMTSFSNQLAVNFADIAGQGRGESIFFSLLLDEIVERVKNKNNVLLIKESTRTAVLLRGLVMAEDGEVFLKIFAKPSAIK